MKPTCSRDLSDMLNTGHYGIVFENKAWADLIIHQSNHCDKLRICVRRPIKGISAKGRIKGSGAKSFPHIQQDFIFIIG